MRPSSQLTSAARLAVSASVILAAALLHEGCSTQSPIHSAHQTAPQATAYLEEVADWSFEAAHPATISSATIAQVLQGIYVRETGSSTRSADGSKPMKAFSDEDVKSLAPLLAHTLSQAKPEYVVAFRLSSSAGSGSEPTAGTLYVQNDQLYVTLIQGSPGRSDSSTLKPARPARAVSFEPQAAGHIEKAAPAVAFGHHDLPMIAVDYLNMDQAGEHVRKTAASPVQVPPVKQAGPVLIASSAGEEQAAQALQDSHEQEMSLRKEQELKEAQESLTRKEAKINSLRRDLESMRQQLEAKDKELRSVKANQTSTKRQKRTAEVVIR